jgi:hypothetical protein
MTYRMHLSSLLPPPSFLLSNELPEEKGRVRVLRPLGREEVGQSRWLEQEEPPWLKRYACSEEKEQVEVSNRQSG